MAKKTSNEAMKAAASATLGRLFFLDLSAGRVLSANPDGTDLKVLASERGPLPDGIVVDVESGHLYWTIMGIPSKEDGLIERSDLDGANITTIIPRGATFTPKQLQLDKENGKLYWCDREGMRVMRSNLDGSNIETLYEAGHGDKDRADLTRWCVGIALDREQRKIYWTQKGSENADEGRIFRAGFDIPAGEAPASRSDVEVLFADLPEPIDLDLDSNNRVLYWTDRGDPPRGNTVNRASLDAPGHNRTDQEIIFTHLMEGIGLALDLTEERMFITDLGGSVYCAKLDGSGKKTLFFAKGNLSGIAYAELPAPE